MTSARFPDLASIDAALAAPEFLVFKHSTTCPVSAKAFAEYEAFCAAWPEVPTAWIDVVAERPWSLHVAAATGVRHESPQAILLRKGRVVWHSSHSAIRRSALADAVSAGR
jgi:bacillithiol system protein YtxJ